GSWGIGPSGSGPRTTASAPLTKNLSGAGQISWSRPEPKTPVTARGSNWSSRRRIRSLPPSFRREGSRSFEKASLMRGANERTNDAPAPRARSLQFWRPDALTAARQQENQNDDGTR